MCGIVGATSTRPDALGWLWNACALLTHRGPDDSGVWRSADGTVGLAHQRLSIIDLSDAAHQPMLTMDGKCAIVFNGEIYNFRELRHELVSLGHKFQSQSDTEVIIAAYLQWGTDCLDRLNGMFAFGLFDAANQRLFLARDRAGEKPLFYTIRNGQLAFASELKALFADPAFERRIDPEALDCYLAFGYVPGERCMLQGAHKLPPAHALVFDVATGDHRQWRYWQLPDPPDSADVNEPALLDELEQLLESAVTRQLIADVPVGIMLSGGVDSSLVTAMAVRSRPELTTFTVRLPGHEFDETEHARLIARHFKTNHMELEATNPPVSLLEPLARQFDEPVVDSSIIPTYLVSRMIREHCKVALGGDGGDELFAGYLHYRRLLWLENRAAQIPHFVLRTASTVAASVMPVGFKGRNWTQALAADLREGLPHIGLIFDAATRRRLMSRFTGWPTVAENIWRDRIPPVGDLLQRATRMDFQNFLPDGVLVKVDRASMLNSLEVRAPLLDHRVIEFAFGKVPSHLKATQKNTKILLKQLARKLLPPAFDLARKHGFSIPLASWVRGGPWRDYFREIFADDSLLFSRAVTEDLMQSHSRGRSNHERLFGLIMFELWRREYGVGLS